MLTVGIDIGSTAVKAALWDGADFQTFLFPTGWNPQESSREAFESLLQKAGAAREDITQIIATGYGRKMCAIAEKKVTEITCHAAGAAKAIPIGIKGPAGAGGFGIALTQGAG